MLLHCKGDGVMAIKSYTIKVKSIVFIGLKIYSSSFLNKLAQSLVRSKQQIIYICNYHFQINK